MRTSGLLAGCSGLGEIGAPRRLAICSSTLEGGSEVGTEEKSLQMDS